MTDTREAFEKWYFEEMVDFEDRKIVFKQFGNSPAYVDMSVQDTWVGYQAAEAHYKECIAELMLEIKKLKTPKWFSTEDEFMAESIEDLAIQMAGYYDQGTEIEVHLAQDLGSEVYVVGQSELGDTILTLKDDQAIAESKE